MGDASKDDQTFEELSSTPRRLAETGINYQECIRDAIDMPNGNICTANDVTFGEFKLISGPTECTVGENITVTIRATIMSGSAQFKEDVGIWVDQGGGNAKDVGNVCYRDFLNPISLNNSDVNLTSGEGPYYNILTDDDLCGDAKPDETAFYDFNVTIQCQDSDGNQIADVGACTSWKQSGSNTAEPCNNATNAIPGTSSKCDCNTITNT